jgi:hypothetical protein
LHPPFLRSLALCPFDGMDGSMPAFCFLPYWLSQMLEKRNDEANRLRIGSCLQAAKFAEQEQAIEAEKYAHLLVCVRFPCVPCTIVHCARLQHTSLAWLVKA